MVFKQKSIVTIGIAVLSLLIAAFAGVYLANGSSDRWVNHADTSWFDIDPVLPSFTIDTPAKLAGVAKLVNDGVSRDGIPINGFENKILDIDRNLDLSDYLWVPIGTEQRPFRGTLLAKDGATYTISGMRLAESERYAGLIGLMDHGTIGGFVFADTGRIYIKNGVNSVYVGSAVAKMINNSTVYNITNHTDIYVDAAYSRAYTGGIVGSGDGSISNSFNYGSITVTDGSQVYAAGIAGYADQSGLIVKRVSNSGAIHSVTGVGQEQYIGGIIGLGSGYIQMDEDATQIGNSATITAVGAVNSYAGGIVGNANNRITFSMLTSNSGAVSIDSPLASGTYAGGLIGAIGSEQADPNYLVTFANSGSVVNNGGANVFTGSIAGRIDSTFIWSQNYTNTVAVSASGVEKVHTGGLVGYSGGQLNFTGEAKNAAAVTVSGAANEVYTGGLIGFAAQRVLFDSTILGAYENSGALMITGGTGVYSGGITGNRAYARTSGEPSDNVSSIGEITVSGVARLYTGGFIGALIDGVDRRVDGARFSSGLRVSAASASDEQRVATGGIVGYASNAILADNGFSGSLSVAAGSAHTYTGGIAGIVDNSSALMHVSVGNSEQQYASIEAGGYIGGVVGQLDGGTVDHPIVAYIDLSLTDQDGFIGGIAGAAAGSIHAAAVGDANYSGADSVKLHADGLDHATFGGIVSLGEGVLAIESSVVTSVEFKNEAGRSDYRIGGIIGLNRGQAQLALQVEAIQFDVLADRSMVGGIVGVNEGEINGNGLTASEHVFVSSASFASLGGIAGFNTGVLTNGEVMNLTMESSGPGSMLGGIVGRSEQAANGTNAVLREMRIYTELFEPLLRTTGAETMAGGIVGFASHTDIQQPAVSAEVFNTSYIVIAAERVMAGGIAGRIEDSLVTGDSVDANIEYLTVSSSAAALNAYVGGVAGFSDRTKLDRLVANDVILLVSGTNATVGGIAGYNRGTDAAVISNVFVSNLKAQINAAAESTIAGAFVGLNDSRTSDTGMNPETAASSIQKSRVTGRMDSLAPAAVVGGMIGENRSLVANNSIADKNPVATSGDASTVGGLVGRNTAEGTLYYTYSNVNLAIQGTDVLVGGLVGSNDGRILTSYMDAEITGNASGTAVKSVSLGGLAGRNTGVIEKSYTASVVAANGVYSNVGGLVGEQAGGTISNSYAAKQVIANNANSYAGGLLGRITGGQVLNSYASGQAIGTNGAYAGGFAGRYDNASKELLNKVFYVMDEENNINAGLSDFADGNHRWLDVPVRLSTVQVSQLRDRDAFPGLSGWDFNQVWRYGSLQAEYKYPELIRSANTGGNDSNDVNQNINWYLRDPNAVVFDIRAEAELAGLAAIVNGTVPGMPSYDFAGTTIRILNPIHIQSSQWEPIGASETRSFQGTFEGNHHLIDGLTITPAHPFSGLFGVIGTDGVVRGIVLEPLNVAGAQTTGVLAGLNHGRVENIELNLLQGMKVSGATVGSFLGRNTGSFDEIRIKLEDGSRIEAAFDNAVVGGVIGVNETDLDPSAFTFNVINGSVGSATDGSTVGGYIGRQAGDISGWQVNVQASYPILVTGANNIVGGMIGEYASGRGADLTVNIADGLLEVRGANAVLGGLIGHSGADNTLHNVKATTSRASGVHIRAEGIIGGIAGSKAGSASGAFDMETALTEKLVLTTLEDSTQSVIGGIAGKLTNAAIQDVKFTAVIQAAGSSAAGGIVGHGHNTIIYNADVVPKLTLTAKLGAGMLGGIAGLMTSDDQNLAIDFGRWIPFYHGIYDSKVYGNGMTAEGLNSNLADLYVGGLVGKNEASIYQSTAASDLTVKGGRIAAAGGITGYNDGYLVRLTAQNGITAADSSIYHVGGIVGQSVGGGIHYTKLAAASGKKITIGSAITRAGVAPAAHAGGFIGLGDATDISNAWTDISVTVSCTNQESTINAGGFAGMLGVSSSSEYSLKRAYAKGAVSVSGRSVSSAGGFAGSVDNYRVSDVYASGNVSHSGLFTRSGGFAGVVERRAIISQAYAVMGKVETTGITGATRSYNGGFTGYNDGSISGVYTGVTALTVNLTGANAHRGALVGYQFRDGRVTDSSYAINLQPAGHNQGLAADNTQQIIAAPLGVMDWDFEYDTLFLTSEHTGEIAMRTLKQLTGAILLYNNATGLEYYKLYNRAATAKLEMEKLLLGADMNLTNLRFVAFDHFSDQFDGQGFTIRGYKAAAAAGDSNVGFFAWNDGEIRNVRFDNMDISGGSRTGIVTGHNRVGGVIEQVHVRGNVQGRIAVGGIAGINEGLLLAVNSRGSVAGMDPLTVEAAGGLAGRNEADGVIEQSFTFADVHLEAVQPRAGGIVGVNEGEIASSYSSGRIVASGLEKAWAGGIAGYAHGGAIRGSLNVGEVLAGVDGKLLPGDTFFGGITGQKSDAAAVEQSLFNKQMLKLNSAYYAQDGSRVIGDANADAAGKFAHELTGASLPSQLDSADWQAMSGYYPRLRAFDNLPIVRLATAAVVLNERDLVNRIHSAFELTRDLSGLNWTVNAGQVSLSTASGKLRGDLHTTGSAVLTATTGGESRRITIQAAALKYNDIASTPTVVSGEKSFATQVTVELATAEAGGQIYYTLNGSQPTEASTLYTAPIVLTNTATIRAITIVENKEYSQPLTGTWVKQGSGIGGGGGSGGGGGGGVISPAPQDTVEPQLEPSIAAIAGGTTVNAGVDKPVAVAKNSRLTLTAPAGQVIYYTTDGSTPTKNSPRFTGNILITGNMTIKAITDKDDRVVTMQYVVEKAKYEIKSNANEIPFIAGYSNGTFKPSAAITRFELIEALAPLLDMEDVDVGSLFTDVNVRQADLVAFFTSAGLIEGYPDGTFRSSKGLTRAEFATIITRLLNLDPLQPTANKLSDVSGHWAEKAIHSLTAAGYVQGFPDGTYRPGEEISRAQATVIINRIVGTRKKEQIESSKYSDLPPDHWAYEEIMNASK